LVIPSVLLLSVRSVMTVLRTIKLGKYLKSVVIIYVEYLISHLNGKL